MSRVNALTRTSIFCRDIDKSLELYRDVLGLTIIEDKIVEGKGIGGMVGLGDCRMHIIYLQSPAPDGALVALFEITNPQPPGLPEPESFARVSAGQPALVFDSDEVHEIYRELDRRGYRVLTPPMRYVKPDDSEYTKAGVYTELIFFDPDNVLISIVQYQPQ
jgi:catechol 2,3-dioxygenase-like lactoylglutathione lyase family enzyme